MKIDVSVILPVYNESACIARTFAEVLDYAKTHANYEFIFVNDGSLDETQTILAQSIQAANCHQIHLISYSPNQGKGYAVKKGFKNSVGRYICFIDSDLAYSLEHLDWLVEKLDYFEVVIGCRNLIPGQSDRIKFIRRIAGKIFNFISRKILLINLSDMQAGVKGFRREVALELFYKQILSRFSFDAELIYLAHKKGFTIGEIPAIVCDSHMRKASKVNLVTDSIKMLFNLLQIRWADWTGLYE